MLIGLHLKRWLINLGMKELQERLEGHQRCVYRRKNLRAGLKSKFSCLTRVP